MAMDIPIEEEHAEVSKWMKGKVLWKIADKCALIEKWLPDRERALRAFLELRRNNVETLFSLGTTLCKLQKLDEGQTLLERADDADPSKDKLFDLEKVRGYGLCVEKDDVIPEKYRRCKKPSEFLPCAMVKVNRLRSFRGRDLSGMFGVVRSSTPTDGRVAVQMFAGGGVDYTSVRVGEVKPPISLMFSNHSESEFRSVYRALESCLTQKASSIPKEHKKSLYGVYAEMFAVPGFLPRLEQKIVMPELLGRVGKMEEAIVMGQGCPSEMPDCSICRWQIREEVANCLARVSRLDEALDCALKIPEEVSDMTRCL